MLLNMPFLTGFSYGYQVPVTDGLENKGSSVTDFKVSVTENPRKQPGSVTDLPNV